MASGPAVREEVAGHRVPAARGQPGATGVCRAADLCMSERPGRPTADGAGLGLHAAGRCTFHMASVCSYPGPGPAYSTPITSSRAVQTDAYVTKLHLTLSAAG